jgi:hypothetical protein
MVHQGPTLLLHLIQSLSEGHTMATKKKLCLSRKSRKAFITAMLERFIPKVPGSDTSRRISS